MQLRFERPYLINECLLNNIYPLSNIFLRNSIFLHNFVSSILLHSSIHSSDSMAITLHVANLVWILV
jgi:hypothetical protein